MRIISGKYRGLKLAEFEGEDVRPTADRVKESLFNIISDRVAGARVLDAFCGSGSLGIECLSRGAEFVHFNDKSAASIGLLKKNLAKLKAENYAITNYDFSRCLSDSDKFDIIFIDPPYRLSVGIEALELVSKNQLLSEGGIAVFERDRAFDSQISGLKKFDERTDGKTFLTFFCADGEE